MSDKHPTSSFLQMTSFVFSPPQSPYEIVKMFLIRDWILLVCFSWRYEATEGPLVNFVMREALFEIYTRILCRFIPPWETNT